MGTRVELSWYESASLGEAKVTFAGSAPVHFGKDIPPEGSVLFDVARGEASERLTLVGEGDFAATHEALGVRLRVLSPYALKLATVELELDEVGEGQG